MQTTERSLEERRAARIIEAVIREAYAQADLVTQFLKALGYWPKKKRSQDPPGIPHDSQATARAEGFLLNLGAALRIALWERAGLRPLLPDDLPTASEAFRNLMPAEDAVTAEHSQRAMPELARKVSEVHSRHFVLDGLATVGADIARPAAPVPEDEFVEALADFLWKHRHLADDNEE